MRMESVDLFVKMLPKDHSLIFVYLFVVLIMLELVNEALWW